MPSATTIPSNGKVTVDVTARNTGKVAGDEVVQLYLHELVTSVTEPMKVLRGFKRVSLAPGASTQVRFQRSPRAVRSAPARAPEFDTHDLIPLPSNGFPIRSAAAVPRDRHRHLECQGSALDGARRHLRLGVRAAGGEPAGPGVLGAGSAGVVAGHGTRRHRPAARLARLAAARGGEEEVCTAPPVERVVQPDGALAALLASRRRTFQRLYRDLKPTFVEFCS